MKLVKMSLVAAVAVASLSTVSFAGAEITGKTDFRWTSSTKGDMNTNGSTRERIDLHVKAPSKDGKGKVHFGVRYDGTAKGSAVNAIKAYADYKLGSVTVGAGPKIGFPGNFSDSTVRGITVSTKVAGFTVGAGVADKDTGSEMDEKSIITAKGKVAIADLRFDYRLGAGKKDYLATDVKVKVGPATIIGAYAAGMGDNNKDVSLMGADVSVGLGTITAYGAFSMGGKMGGGVTELTDSTNALGNIAGANGAGEVTAMKFGAKTKVAGIAVGGFYSMATPDGGDTSSKIYVDAKKSLNAQSSVNVRYYMDKTGKTGDDDSKNTIELRFASKF